MVSPLIKADWLMVNLDNVKVLDASSHLPGSGRDATAEYAASRIPGAGRFDIGKVADPDNPLPHMIPSSDDFATAIS